MGGIITVSYVVSIISGIIQYVGVPAKIATVAAKVIFLGLIGIPTSGAAYVVFHPIEYSMSVEQIEILETIEATIYADNVILDIVGGYCGITGNYNVTLNGVAGVDLSKAKRFTQGIANIVTFKTWYELPMPNLQRLNVEKFQIVSESTSLGCKVDFNEARDLAKHLAKVKFLDNALLDTLLEGSKNNTIDTFSERLGVTELYFYDDDNGNKSSVDIPLQYKCWGLNNGKEGQFVKRC